MAKMCFQPVEWHLDMRISHSGPVLRRKVWQLTECLNPSFVIVFQKNRQARPGIRDELQCDVFYRLILDCRKSG